MTCLLVNQLAFPGLGTVMAKRWSGYGQMALTLAGFALFVGFIMWFMMGMLQVASDPSGDIEIFRKHAWDRSWIIAAGLAICAVAWVWALFSSLSILRESRAAAVSSPMP